MAARSRKQVETLTHAKASRKNIPTAEYEPVMSERDRTPIRVAYERRNHDLDPQLVWHGKDVQDWSDLVVPTPPLFIQEKVQPKVLIDDLLRQSRESSTTAADQLPNLFADFNGLPEGDAKTEFYRHDANWSNRMILGDSLQVMGSLAEREGLRGKVQCIYMDPPYGIKFNSNFQWSTTSRDVRDGKAEHITREPEQVKAFRDTWRDGIHSYLTYLRDRLTVARDLLTESGSIFVQIGDENVHRVRTVMDEVFGEDGFVSVITYRVSSGTTKERSVKGIADYLLWYSKDTAATKFRRILQERAIEPRMYSQVEELGGFRRSMTAAEKRDTSKLPVHARAYQKLPLHSMNAGNHEPRAAFGSTWRIPPMRSWRYSPRGFRRLLAASRIQPDRTVLRALYYHDDYPAAEIGNVWTDTGPEIAKSYVVQTSTRVIQRCILMTTDPGDLVLDPTCGAGTTAYVAERWGRRWITVDTSRVALALARARVMGARYPYYLLADSNEGLEKEAHLARRPLAEARATHGDIRQGFVYERVPHITLRSVANNAEIDEIWDEHQPRLEQLRTRINRARNEGWEEWDMPRHAEDPWDERAEALFTRLQGERRRKSADDASILRKNLEELNACLGRRYTLDSLPERPADPWPPEHAALHADWWKGRRARQNEIDASIAANANYEYLYDKPYEDRRKIRVSGPFTVESLSPHREMAVDENDGLVDRVAEKKPDYGHAQDFVGNILDNLRTTGVQQAHKEDRIAFSSLAGWPGKLVCAEGRFVGKNQRNSGGGGGASEQRAGIFIGPEFGTVTRPDLAVAAREAAEAGFDVLIACAFNYEAHAADFNKLGRIPVLKARMNADLHMAGELKNTGKGNLFVVFGEPDIDIISAGNGEPEDDYIQVKIRGVDVFHPGSGEIRSDGADGIACWFIDTDYNEESFFVRHAYFLGASDPYKSLKTSLKAEINPDAWATLRSDTSRPFPRPKTGRIAVKVINHLGDEVMKVFRA